MSQKTRSLQRKYGRSYTCNSFPSLEPRFFEFLPHDVLEFHSANPFVSRIGGGKDVVGLVSWVIWLLMFVFLSRRRIDTCWPEIKSFDKLDLRRFNESAPNTLHQIVCVINEFKKDRNYKQNELIAATKICIIDADLFIILFLNEHSTPQLLSIIVSTVFRNLRK